MDRLDREAGETSVSGQRSPVILHLEIWLGREDEEYGGMISLREVIEAKETSSDDTISYLDPDTAEITTITVPSECL